MIFSDFTSAETKVFARLNTPQKIQDYLNKLPINFELRGETCWSPREVLKHKQAHCAEGAIFAAVCLWYNGEKPLLVDLRAVARDDDHVVCLFKRHAHFGAISKTNHAVLRYREPVYKTVRELALSYFHEYFMDDGKKTLREFSVPYDLSKIKNRSWLTTNENLFGITDALDSIKHYKFVTRAQIKTLRRAEPIEIAAGKLTEWRPNGKRVQ